MIPGLYQLIMYLTVPYGLRYKMRHGQGTSPAKETQTRIPVPSGDQPQPPPYQWNNPHLVEEYEKLKEDYKNDPERFGTILRIVLGSMARAGRSDVFQPGQVISGAGPDGPVPVEPEPVQPEPVVPAAPEIKKGWYFYADGKLYDGFTGWPQLNAAMDRLTERGVREISEVEYHD